MVKNWALVIGINHYDFLQPLKYAKRDAQLMQQLLCNEVGFERVFLFSDDSPDIGGESTRPYRANLLQCLRQLFNNPFMTEEDNFWFFFSGHGIRHADHDYLMPLDGDPNDIENTGISLSYLTECFGCCGTKNIVMILDACRHQQKQISEGIGRQAQQIANQTGVISILSCTPQESSGEIDALQTGAFTHALLEGLGIQGQCATVKRLQQYLRFRVSELVQHYKYPQQTPEITATKPDLILVPQYANLDDIAQQQINTFPPEVNQNLEIVEPLVMNAKVVATRSDVHTVVKVAPQISELWVGTSETQTNPISADAIACLSSEPGVDYTHLQDLLAAGQWRAADRETLTLMLKVAARTKQGWLDIESINKFPNTDLATIDQLWVKYSNGRFGFSIQKRIWESIGGIADADYQTWCEFCDRIGWRQNHYWLFYSDLTFSSSAPLGHFPAAASVNLLTVRRGWVVGLCSCLVGFSALASRLAKSSL
ncbi:MAG: GUN4 domain-containing protein [Goleter apudmare HA4340-LM2]|nr:GUN4 domain-containing protein [Goleter apudmare HA4340-LM2]